MLRSNFTFDVGKNGSVKGNLNDYFIKIYIRKITDGNLSPRNIFRKIDS